MENCIARRFGDKFLRSQSVVRCNFRQGGVNGFFDFLTVGFVAFEIGQLPFGSVLDFKRNSFGFMFVDCSNAWVKCDASKNPHSCAMNDMDLSVDDNIAVACEIRIFLRYSMGDVLNTFLKYLKKLGVDMFTIFDRSSTVILE